MMKLPFALFVFCTAICLVSCFKCYQCVRKSLDVEEYTTKQCLKDQKIVDCINRNVSDPTEYACVRMHSVSDDDVEYEMRACYIKSICEERKKRCEDKAQMKEQKIKECTMTCCVSDGDTPCNSGFTVFNDPIAIPTMMLAVLCALKLF
ncbi:uncharacterized protein LOC111335946 [Stylophora pistillata]|nr:uncharacterized protein LOC111335946 [Stylophora pistillata]